ncbi:cyclin-dependent kinase 11B-like [Lineus longissimus]|uniref:cyclin-dependent kinase 11B-like n=1 Tax=Lineus longissimus TaxID=88925 RepID=UPI002B4D3B19
MSDSALSNHSSLEHGELDPSPDVRVVEVASSVMQSTKKRATDFDSGEDDSLTIKPPPPHAKKEKKHKMKHHKEERRRDRDDKRGDRYKSDGHREKERNKERVRQEKEREMMLKEQERLRERDVSKLAKEARRREQSRIERERLEEVERQKRRERHLRAERQKEEERRQRQLEATWREEQRRREMEKRRPQEQHRSRSPQMRERPEKRRKQQRTPEERASFPPEPIESPPPDSDEAHEEYLEEVEMEPSEVEESPEHSVSEESASESEESEESASDSGDTATSASGSESSGAEDHGEEEDKSHAPQHHIKSKFENESDDEAEDVRLPPMEESEHEYIEETPPASPVELKEELPVYLPAIEGCRNVDEFNCLNRIEEGTYGVVYRAKDKKTNEIVALKRLKMEKEKEGFPITSLREINTLLKAQHINIVTVREIVVGSNMDKIYIVMDYVEHDLKSLIETMKNPFLVGEVKTLMAQLLSAVVHLHDNWILHRDLKTSNLLLSHKGILKVGDFGLAREYGSPLKQYTPVVVTLWYRAPELLLGTKEYSCPIDLWSVGCIFAEFLLMKPLFPGKSEIDQLNRIFKDLGTPNERIWPGVGELPGMKKCSFTEYPYNQLRNKFGSFFSDLGWDLLNRFLTYNPAKRVTGEEALKHDYFKEAPLPVQPHMFPTWPAKSEQAPRKHGNSPKPPSGGKAYSKLLEEEMQGGGLGFHMGGTSKGVSACGPGFSLKF